MAVKNRARFLAAIAVFAKVTRIILGNWKAAFTALGYRGVADLNQFGADIVKFRQTWGHLAQLWCP